MEFPEFRVTSSGGGIRRVVWDPRRATAFGSYLNDDTSVAFDMTNMGIREVARVIRQDEVPTVTVTFEARLVELEEES